MEKCPRDGKENNVLERHFFSTPHQPVSLMGSRIWVLKLKGLSNPAGRAMATFPYRDQQSFGSICDLNTSYKGPLSSSPCPSPSFFKTQRHPELVMLNEPSSTDFPTQHPVWALWCGAASSTLHPAPPQSCSGPEFPLASPGFRHKDAPEDLCLGASLHLIQVKR